ncbi:MAG: ATP-binding protein, partial [Lachnospiraceae bacterium]|nr:ATP-binding protein [Lachnospiraceae bacterium]
TLQALTRYLKKEYVIVSLDFQTMGSSSFETEQNFVAAFAGELLDAIPEFPKKIEEHLRGFAEGTARILSLNALFKVIIAWCKELDRAPVLIIDEADTASNNQVFLDFLAQLRAYYLKRPDVSTFQSVILAGVYDVQNIRHKIRPEIEHRTNSPWNIAAKFPVDMSFSEEEIYEMLKEYESDYHTGMDVEDIAKLIHSYTSGYPVLVSNICKILDEEIAGSKLFPGRSDAWTGAGLREAVNELLFEKNALFDSLISELTDYPELKEMIYRLLFRGETIAYSADDSVMNLLLMFGFAKVEYATVQIANRIFEMRLYNYFLTLPEVRNGEIYRLASQDRSQFIENGQLNMTHLLEKFVEYFDDIYGDQGQTFIEEDGRRYFMLFLKPIINGTGNYYAEARTRNQERTDLIIDYLGKQYIIELKIWRGNAYHERGEKQLSDYLDYYHLKKGYMLSFNFNKKKEIGVKEIVLGDRILVEAVV